MFRDCCAVEPDYEDDDLEWLYWICLYVPVKYSNKFRHIGWDYIKWVKYIYVQMIDILP